MEFGIHNSSWLDDPDPSNAFERAKAKAQWAEENGFTRFSVLDHMIQIPRVGDPPRRAGAGRLDGPGRAGRRHQPHPPRHPVHGGRVSQSRAPRQDRGDRRSDQPGAPDARPRGRLLRGRVPAVRLGVPAAAGDPAALAAKRERLADRGPLRGFVGTISEAVDLVGQHLDAGIDLLIYADRRGDEESRELFASDVMPHFA